MSHLIDTTKGRAAIAYRGETPWHGLGFQIESTDDVETIRHKAGLDFEILKADAMFAGPDGQIRSAASLNRSILYRSDTLAPLSVMSTKGYHVVQPDQILGFIDESVRAMGWTIETAGSLNGGRKVWALAKMGEQATIGKGDDVGGYLLAATACDGSMASEFMFTSVRVVCNNTLHMSLNNDRKAGARVKVYHFNKLDTSAVKKELGIAGSVWANFIEQAKRLASIRLSDKQAVQVLRTVYAPVEEKEVEGEVVTDDQFLKANTSARKVLELYQGDAIGAELATARGTAWGLVNATTEYYDHVSNTRSTDNRLNSAWFGAGADRKQDVVDACLQVAA